MSKKNFGDERGYRPLQTPKTEGNTSVFWQPNPLMYHFDGGRAEKVVTFLTTFFSTKKQCLGPKYGIFPLFKA
jgi:hypothetical protein